MKLLIREKCPYSKFFWSIFSRIQTVHGEIRENMDQKNAEYEHFLHSVYLEVAEYVTARIKDDNLRKQRNSSRNFKIE